ncbi:RNase A-like domain-containing protein [Streptomyces griseus]|uniref:RNase A-like domain-containing protein n=1 Tax=Streptomyces griseus TaxID=1911 RepID=UPI003807BD4B
MFLRDPGGEPSAAHALDKHGGKTDKQLFQRLRGERKPDTGDYKIPGASTYSDIESAQRYTQYCLRDNAAEIDDWLNEEPPKPTKEIRTPSIPLQGPLLGNAVTGRGTTVDGDGRPSEVSDNEGVAIRLLYKPDLNPPYIVFSSMPQ